MVTKEQRNAQKRAWENANEKVYRLKLNKSNPRDAAIIEWMADKNISSYLRELVLKDMNKAESD